MKLVLTGYVTVADSRDPWTPKWDMLLFLRSIASIFHFLLDLAHQRQTPLPIVVLVHFVHAGTLSYVHGARAGARVQPTFFTRLCEAFCEHLTLKHTYS